MLSTTWLFVDKKKKVWNLSLIWVEAEVGPDPEYWIQFRQDSAFFFRTRNRTGHQKFVKNRTRSHFSISAVAGVCAVIS